MAEIPDYLVPTDGLTNSYIRFGGLDVNYDNGGGADVRFGIYNEDGQFLANFVIPVLPTERDGSVDALIAGAHRQMCDVLRQWLYMTDRIRQAYEKSAAPANQGGTSQ
jgi:hypothetical protein